jgi:hypothetical protein
MGNRRPFTWTELQFDKLNKVKDILLELEEFKPLTLRQIYYQMVGKGYIENNVSQYGMLSKLLKHARIERYIKWEDIEDRVRTYHDLTGWQTSERFIKASLDGFLKNYQRDLLQSQNVYPEIWIEKDALSSIFTRASSPYTIPVVVCRGFSSVSFLNDYKVRLSYYPGKKPILLYFGDFDPSGVEMLTAMETTLKDELNVDGIEFKRIALLKEDIYTYKLPHSPEALKKTDTRARKHIAEYGELAVELDALSPPVLQAKIKTAIEDVLDMDSFIEERDTESFEFDKLNRIKEEVGFLVHKYL